MLRLTKSELKKVRWSIGKSSMAKSKVLPVRFWLEKWFLITKSGKINFPPRKLPIPVEMLVAAEQSGC